MRSIRRLALRAYSRRYASQQSNDYCRRQPERRYAQLFSQLEPSQTFNLHPMADSRDPLSNSNATNMTFKNTAIFRQKSKI